MTLLRDEEALNERDDRRGLRHDVEVVDCCLRALERE